MKVTNYSVHHLAKIAICLFTVASCQSRGHTRRQRQRVTTSRALCYENNVDKIHNLQPANINLRFRNKVQNLQFDINLITAHLACKFERISCSNVPLNAIMSSFPTLNHQLSQTNALRLVRITKALLTESYYKITNIEKILNRRVWRREYRTLRQLSHTLSNDLHSFVCYIHGAGYDNTTPVPARFETKEESVLLLHYVKVIKNLQDLLAELSIVI